VSLPAFTKPPLGLADQLNLLIARGLIVADPAQALHDLRHIGYYRLSGYAQFFQTGDENTDRHRFNPNITFDDILDCYSFDRKLRLLAMDAIERIENSVRSALSNYPAIRHGAHWYIDPALFRTTHDNRPFNHASFINTVKDQIGHNHSDKNKRDTHIYHYYNTYGSPEMPPCWMVFQSVSFGTISIAFRFLIDRESKPIAQSYGISHDVLSSWLHSVSYIRNACAHHALLWTRKSRIKPIVARAFKDDLTPNSYVYAQLVVMQILLHKIATNNHWAQNLRDLINNHPNISLSSMGFPTDWKSRSIWRF
jgi:abortive infection bacteriophage resistance protein